MLLSSYPYDEILMHQNNFDDDITLIDHLGGFDSAYHNRILSHLDKNAKGSRIFWHQFIDPSVQSRYPNIRLMFDVHLQNKLNLQKFKTYTVHPPVAIKNFLCSFNGSSHVGRKLLVTALFRMGWFNIDTCTKNFVFSRAQLDGHLRELCEDPFLQVAHKFFGANRHLDFFSQTCNSFGYDRFDHGKNIYNLQEKLSSSFVHIVSETIPTSYCPFITEKFLYSVVTRGLFLAYAQPGWHQHLEKFYGFKKFSRLFDYQFDLQPNPVSRLLELVSALTKFSVLDHNDWQNLYEFEKETIEFNYDHYFSGDYLRHLELYSTHQ